MLHKPIMALNKEIIILSDQLVPDRQYFFKNARIMRIKNLIMRIIRVII